MEIQPSRTWEYYSNKENIVELISRTNLFIDPVTTRRYKIDMFNVTTKDWKKTIFVVVDINTTTEYYSIVDCVYTNTPRFNSKDSNISVDTKGTPVSYLAKNRGNISIFPLTRYSRQNLERNSHQQESSVDGTPTRRTVRFEDSVDRVTHRDLSDANRRYHHPEIDVGDLLKNIRGIISEEFERISKRSTNELLSSKSSIVIEGYHREGVHLDVAEFLERIKNRLIQTSPFNFLDVDRSRIHDHSVYNRTLSLSLTDQNSLHQIRKECHKVDTLIFLSRDKRSPSEILMNEIKKFTELRHLCLMDIQCPQGIYFYDILTLKSLETLYLREVTIRAPKTTLVLLKSVKVLTIHDCHFVKMFDGNDDDQEQLTLGRFPKNIVVVRFLSKIYQWSIRDEPLPVPEINDDNNFCGLRNSVKSLHVKGSRDLASISDIGYFPNLERLYINKCYNVEFRTEDIERFGRLKVIYFINCVQESLFVDIDLDLLIEREVRIIVIQGTVEGLD